MTARDFKTADEFRHRLSAYHARQTALLVGFYQKASGLPGISYKEAVDEALCFGWIDAFTRRDPKKTRRSIRRSSAAWPCS